MSEDSTGNHELVEELWRAHRRRVLDVAYRVLGSVSDAEDIATEAYTRLLVSNLDEIDDVAGWLVTVAGRLCIDRLRSADHRRRAYVGPWLPEPLVGLGDTSAVDPADRITLDDSVRLGLLVVLEHLSPAERTSFVLHDVFAVPFDEIADIVGRSPAACRQLASRARKRIQTDPETPRTTISRHELSDIAEKFAAACAGGALEPFLDVLDPDVVGDFDSGGVIPGAPLRAVHGSRQVAQIFVHAFAGVDLAFSVEDVNGDPGVIGRRGERIAVVIALTAKDGRIDLLHGVGNPDKLRHLER